MPVKPLFGVYVNTSSESMVAVPFEGGSTIVNDKLSPSGSEERLFRFSYADSFVLVEVVKSVVTGLF